MTTTQSGPPAPLIVGVDIGGTKTHLRTKAPGFVRDRIIPTVNWRTRDWHEDARRLLGLVHELNGDAPVAALGVGAHGCDDNEECELFRAAVQPLCDFPVMVLNDAELMPYASGLPGQIGLVAGTGSIAVHRDACNVMRVAGGWGWVVGDEGSASGLMREAVRVVALHLDEGGNTDEPLVRRIMGALEVPRAARLGSVFSSIGRVGEAGRHAAQIFDAAREDSTLASRVIEHGARGLADLLRRLERRGVRATHVIAGGAVIVAQPLLWAAFSEAAETVSEGRIQPVLFSGKPVEGACLLAESLLNDASTSAQFLRQS